MYHTDEGDKQKKKIKRKGGKMKNINMRNQLTEMELGEIKNSMVKTVVANKVFGLQAEKNHLADVRDMLRDSSNVLANGLSTAKEFEDNKEAVGLYLEEAITKKVIKNIKYEMETNEEFIKLTNDITNKLK